MRDQQKKLRLLMLGLGVAAVAWCGAYLIGNTDDDIAPDLNYTAIIKDVKKSVYDGDTILDVPALLYRLDEAEIAASAPLWPGIQKRADGIYVLSDIRLRGIDAPEKRVSTKLPEEVRNRIKKRAAAAEAFLENLIEQSSVPGQIAIRNPEHDKYAGRVVADVIVYRLRYISNGVESVEINAADALIKARLAVPYEGGAKTFDWGAESLDFD